MANKTDLKDKYYDDDTCIITTILLTNDIYRGPPIYLHVQTEGVCY